MEVDMDKDKLRRDLIELIAHRLFWARTDVVEPSMLRDLEEAPKMAYRSNYIFRAQVDTIVADIVFVMESQA
jgi:hypothetical protein